MARVCIHHNVEESCPDCTADRIATLERELAKTTSVLHTIQADLSVARRELAEAQRNLTACQDNYQRALAEIEVQQEEVERLQGEKEKGTTRWQDEILKMPPRTRDSGVFLTHERLEAKENAARAEGAREMRERCAIKALTEGAPSSVAAAIRALGEES